jgi:hypothetical protein
MSRHGKFTPAQERRIEARYEAERHRHQTRRQKMLTEYANAVFKPAPVSTGSPTDRKSEESR